MKKLFGLCLLAFITCVSTIAAQDADLEYNEVTIYEADTVEHEYSLISIRDGAGVISLYQNKEIGAKYLFEFVNDTQDTGFIVMYSHGFFSEHEIFYSENLDIKIVVNYNKEHTLFYYDYDEINDYYLKVMLFRDKPKE